MQEFLKRVERLRAEALKPSSEALDENQDLPPRKFSGAPAISNEGCEKCDYTGTINSFRWEQPEGYPIKIQVAVVENCSCHMDRMFLKYNASESFNAKERSHTFKNATMDNMNEIQFNIAMDFVTDIKKHMELGTWLYIFGDDARVNEVSREKGAILNAYGTGKTYLMQCMANAFSLRKIPAIYVTESKLYGEIKATYNRDSEESEIDVLQRYYNVPILMIDDIFTAQYKDWAEGMLYNIIDERMKNNKVTIMTSNYALGRIRERLPLNGGKIGSRINGKAELIEMLGPDRRPQSKSEPA
jgi:DNA replication protein DnaC